MPVQPALLLTVALIVLGRSSTLGAQSSTTQTTTDSTRVTAESARSIFAGLRLLPVLTRAPETGLAFGAALVQVRRFNADTSTRPTTNEASLIATQKHQLTLYLEREVWTTANRWRLNGVLSYERYPLPFYGVFLGSKASLDPLQYYTTDTYAINAAADRRIAPGLYVGLGYKGIRNTPVAQRPSDLLANGSIVGGNGGTVSGIEQSLTYDTRDNIYGARHGSYLLLQHFNAARFTGSDFTESKIKVEARRFLPIRTEHAFALQAQYEASTGNVPFEQLPTIGGSNVMRGYVFGRFRDRQIASAQAELRVKVIGRFGVASWFGGAVVCGSHCVANWGDVLPTSGVGVRYFLIPAERLTLRLDFGFGRHSNGFYLDFTEAF